MEQTSVTHVAILSMTGKVVSVVMNLVPTDFTADLMVMYLGTMTTRRLTTTTRVFTITAIPPVVRTLPVLRVLVTLMTGTDHPTIILSTTMAMIWFISLTTIIGLITSLDVAADSYLMIMRMATVFR